MEFVVPRDLSQGGRWLKFERRYARGVLLEAGIAGDCCIAVACTALEDRPEAYRTVGAKRGACIAAWAAAGGRE